MTIKKVFRNRYSIPRNIYYSQYSSWWGIIVTISVFTRIIAFITEVVIYLVITTRNKRHCSAKFALNRF